MTAADAPRFAAAAPATAIQIVSAIPGLGAKYRATAPFDALTGAVTEGYHGWHAFAGQRKVGTFSTPQDAEKALLGALLAEIATAGSVTSAFPAAAAPLAAAA